MIETATETTIATRIASAMAIAISQAQPLKLRRRRGFKAIASN
jgi:hypothetical protein